MSLIWGLIWCTELTYTHKVIIWLLQSLSDIQPGTLCHSSSCKILAQGTRQLLIAWAKVASPRLKRMHASNLEILQVHKTSLFCSIRS